MHPDVMTTEFCTKRIGYVGMPIRCIGKIFPLSLLGAGQYLLIGTDFTTIFEHDDWLHVKLVFYKPSKRSHMFYAHGVESDILEHQNGN